MRRPTHGARRPVALTILALVLAILSSGAGTPVAAATLPATRTISTAASDWVGTGIAPKAGTRLKLTATGSGTYCSGCIAPTPAGDPGNMSICGGGYSGLSGVACIALVGRWHGGSAFVIGEKASITAPGGKELQLGIHDWKFDDNSGSYRVKITEVGFDLSGVLRWRDCTTRPCKEVPIPNAERYRVEARRAGDSAPRQAVVGLSGRYRFRSLPAGTWLVYPQIIGLVDDEGLGASEWHPATRSIKLDADVDGVSFLWCGRLTVGPAAGAPCPEVKVSGRLVDALGDPYGGVEMTIASENAVERDTTDARGRFSFTVPRGTYVLRYDGPGGPQNSHQVSATRDRTDIVVRTGRPRFEIRNAPTIVSILIEALPAAGGRFVARIARGKDLAGCVEDMVLTQRRNAGANDVTFTTFTFEVPEGEHFCGGRWTAMVVWQDRSRPLVKDEFVQP